MPVSIYHASPPDFLACQPAGTKYLHVADVETDDLEVAFEKTNSIDAPWWENKGVAKTFTGKGARSTSVGDLAFYNGVFYRCESCGWEPYTPRES